MTIKKASVIQLIIFFSIAISSPCFAKSFDEHITIVPLGNVDKRVVDELAKKLPSLLPMSAKTEVYKREEIPPDSYYSARNQYNADVILNYIANNITVSMPDERLLVVMAADIYTPDVEFVFGLVDAKRGVSVISLARLEEAGRSSVPGRPASLDRALKEALRQYGLSRGLDNCPDSSCAMHEAKNIAEIDRQRVDLCLNCRIQLSKKFSKPLMNAPLPVLFK